MKNREAAPLAEGAASLALYEEIGCCLSKFSPRSSAAQKGMIEVQAEKGGTFEKEQNNRFVEDSSARRRTGR